MLTLLYKFLKHSTLHGQCKLNATLLYCIIKMYPEVCHVHAHDIFNTITSPNTP